MNNSKQMKTSQKTDSAIVRQVVFPKPLFELIKVRLSQLGISAPEYVRQLVIEDVKPLYKDVPMVDTETEESIGRALDDLSNRRLSEIRSSDDLQAYLDKLSDS